MAILDDETANFMINAVLNEGLDSVNELNKMLIDPIGFAQEYYLIHNSKYCR